MKSKNRFGKAGHNYGRTFLAGSEGSAHKKMAVYGHERRIPFLAAVSVLICSMGGSVLGWPSMHAILLRDGLLLPPACAANVSAGTCTEQEEQLPKVEAAGSVRVDADEA